MKKTPIGEIPVDWALTTLGQCLREPVRNGYSPNCPDRPTGRWILSLSAVSPEGFNPRGVKPAPADSRVDAFMLKPKDIVVSRSNTRELVGLAGLYAGIPEQCSYSDLLMRVRVDEGRILPEFALLALLAPFGRQYFASSARGTSGTMVKINGHILEQFPVPLPPAREQKQISAVLGSWDEAIQQNLALLAAKRRLKAGLMQRLLTGKHRFPTFDKGGKAGSNGWKTYHLGELFDERVETGRGDLPLLSITGDRGVVDRNDLDKKDTSNADKGKYLRIAPGDIGYNTMRMWQGVSALSALEGIVSPAYTVCIPKADKIDGTFAAYFFKFQPVVHRFWRYSQGMVDDTLNLKFHNFAQVRVKIPSLEEQREIAALLSGCDAEIALLDKELEALREQKKGLMQKLLTGKVRVHRGKEGP